MAAPCLVTSCSCCSITCLLMIIIFVTEDLPSFNCRCFCLWLCIVWIKLLVAHCQGTMFGWIFHQQCGCMGMQPIQVCNHQDYSWYTAQSQYDSPVKIRICGHIQECQGQQNGCKESQSLGSNGQQDPVHMFRFVLLCVCVSLFDTLNSSKRVPHTQ